MAKDIDFLAEWAVWANLDSKTDMELILLKGHLLLEIILNIILNRNEVTNYNSYSFHHKIAALGKIYFDDEIKKQFIILALKNVNRLRNRLAHEFYFDIQNEGLDLWATNVLEQFEGTKFTKYTSITRIKHSFSILTKNILELR